MDRSRGVHDNHNSRLISTGVSWRSRGTWRVQITYKWTPVTIGMCAKDKEEDAAKLYDKAVMAVHELLTRRELESGQEAQGGGARIKVGRRGGHDRGGRQNKNKCV